MQKKSVKINWRRKAFIGLLGLMILLIGIFYFNTRKKIEFKKAESDQSTSKSADSILIEKLSNEDTITSLQDPIDTTKR